MHQFATKRIWRLNCDAVVKVWLRNLQRAGLLVALMTSEGHADVNKLRLAVLEVRNTADIRPGNVAYLAENIRVQASKTLPQESFLVLTRESIDALMPPGKSLQGFLTGVREVEVGRWIGADYIVSGEVLRNEKHLRIVLRGVNCRTAVVFEASASGAETLEMLDANLADACRKLLGLLRADAGLGQSDGSADVGEVVGNAAGNAEVGEVVTHGELMWTVHDNGRDVDWNEAKRYCEACQASGYSDWRMPTIEELQGLYDEAQSYNLKGIWSDASEWSYDVHIARPFILTTPWQWSSDVEGSAQSWYFGFEDRQRYSEERVYRDGGRVLCVRRSQE